MQGLVLTFVLIFAVGAALLWAGTLFIQGYIYSEPVEQLYWRAPLASLILTLFWAFWCRLDYRSIEQAPQKKEGDYTGLYDFSARDDERFDHFWAVKNGREILYKRVRTAAGRFGYQHDGKPWSRSDAEGVVQAIIVEDQEGHKSRFDAELKDGKFKAAPGQPVRYVEEDGQGRVMTDDYIGEISTVRGGRIVGYVLLNLFHLALWFGCLWLVLRFQWSHALGLGILVWGTLTLLVLPALLHRTEDAARQQAVPTAAPVARSIAGCVLPLPRLSGWSKGS